MRRDETRLKAEKAELEAVAAYLPGEQLEEFWTSEAQSAMRNGEAYKLGYCLGKLPSTPLLDRLSELFLGDARDWKIHMVHKARHRPRTDTQEINDALLVH